MHYAGTPGDERLARWMAHQLLEAGFRTTIESFTARVPQARRLRLQILSRHVVNVSLREGPIPADPDGSRPDAPIPFNAWSGSGTVTAPVVSAGRGLDDDYRSLDVRGKIVLVRYGAEFRGLLAARAQRHGAAGVILYSDPADRDGSSHGPAYPNGPYRPLGSVQRGSLGAGIRIPVLPVSALVAQQIERAHAPVRLTVVERFASERLWNTIGVLDGTNPRGEVVLGGHRDAWVYGVTDNGDGVSTLIETAKALGALARTGWRPERSIVVAGWDGEEIGELGSIAYVRAHLDRLRAGCVAYINMDEGESGRNFEISTAAALAGFAADVARSVPDPQKAPVREPGGGSDVESFLYDAGIPTIDWGFSGPFGVYHSAFDDLRYAMTEADPGFLEHRIMAQMIAIAAYRLADEPLHQLYHFTAYAQVLRAALAAVPAADRAGVAPLASAVDRFVAQTTDVRANDDAVLDAVHRLNLLCYGRSGYAALPLPDLSAALASRDTAAIRAAAARTATTLDGITSELSAGGS